MNFLELVQDVARQSGTLAGGTTLASVSGVSGRADKIVNWVQKAWRSIQIEREDWRWMRREFTADLIAGNRRYTPASFNITSFSRWGQDTEFYKPFTLYDPDRGQQDEQEVKFIPYDRWRTAFDRGVHDQMRPTVYTISDAGELCFGNTPDKAYVLNGEYWKGPQQLVANTDIPEMPERFHETIVWRAMDIMAKSDESPTTIQVANVEFQTMWRDLCSDQLPSVTLSRGNVLA